MKLPLDTVRFFSFCMPDYLSCACTGARKPSSEHMQDTPTEKEILIEKEVKQGCILSPALFSLYNKTRVVEGMKDWEGISIDETRVRDQIC